MGYEDQDNDTNASGYQGIIGLVIALTGTCSFVALLVIIIIILFCAKSQQRSARHHNDLLHLVRIQISPINSSVQSGPNNNCGLDPEIIASLPKILYKETDVFKQGEVVECSVCLGSVVEDDAVRVLPNCKHMFHVDCVDTWLNSNTTCPLCRRVADPRIHAAS